ncbi:hypothetical protein B0T14DRAFT_325269 [Immersiella caudata]|uniref:Uncharacterized protein n=1 Tax=Immersiella caudata TaxID=314043 RepID=A0AA39TXS0_9PEZI|nr:hypothetical protein B0T14DRAFT_325269 [Immersiella caudata]
MGEPGMKALAECTTSRKRAAVARFFNDHMHFTPAVDVALKTTGFASYFFRLKVSFIAFRWHKQLRKDIRVKPRGAQANPPSRRSWIPPLQSWMNRRPEPVSQTSPRTQSLRRSWTATCLGTQSSDDGDAPRLPCFYETQLSMMLYGFDDRVYDVYGSSDNYYLPKSKYSATAHHNVWKRSKKLNIWDPFSRLSCIVDRPIWESRHYFLYIWAEYIMEASREWEPITRLLKDAVKQRYVIFFHHIGLKDDTYVCQADGKAHNSGGRPRAQCLD